MKINYKFINGDTVSIEVESQWAETIKEMDHELKLHDRYEDEAKDALVERKKKDSSLNKELPDVIEGLSDYQLSPERVLFAECKKENPLISYLERYTEYLTDDQRELIFLLYGQKMKIIDIANLYGVSEAAIRKRRDKILKRLTKFFKNDGFEV